jgi:hypothetical protein
MVSRALLYSTACLSLFFSASAYFLAVAALSAASFDCRNVKFGVLVVRPLISCVILIVLSCCWFISTCFEKNLAKKAKFHSKKKDQTVLFLRVTYCAITFQQQFQFQFQ